jgi:hypothetical protein
MQSIYGITLVGFMALAMPADAQTHGSHPHGTGTHPATPYASLEQRPIKALSTSKLQTCGRVEAWVWPYRLNSTAILARCM